ncbi:low molecular weight protein-tyrosine-phosphatase [Lactovum odontotermitis]
MKICFVCLGNICRSPMAEMILRSIAPSSWEIASRATSSWEHGNPVHPGTQKVLRQHKIFCDPQKRSRKISPADFEYFDKIIGMDQSNLENLQEMAPAGTEHKISKLLARDVPDPWYTNDFEETYELVNDGCEKIVQEM